ncbi:hypothetical protein MMC13_003263 [Lambiella insularis]|nr:hypothetical protein [Lambiella insularis]
MEASSLSLSHNVGEQETDRLVLKKINHYVRGHPFIQQSLIGHTTTQRRTFEREIYDYARGLGLNKEQTRNEVLKARSFCGELEYDSDESKLDDEVDDLAKVLATTSTTFAASLGSGAITDLVLREDTMSIPNNQMGAIIGMEESNIKAIRQISGSEIHIEGQVENINERMIRIRGTLECNKVAISLLTGATLVSGVGQPEDRESTQFVGIHDKGTDAKHASNSLNAAEVKPTRSVKSSRKSKKRKAEDSFRENDADGEANVEGMKHRKVRRPRTDIIDLGQPVSGHVSNKGTSDPTMRVQRLETSEVEKSGKPGVSGSSKGSTITHINAETIRVKERSKKPKRLSAEAGKPSSKLKAVESFRALIKDREKIRTQEQGDNAVRTETSAVALPAVVQMDLGKTQTSLGERKKHHMTGSKQELAKQPEETLFGSKAQSLGHGTAPSPLQVNRERSAVANDLEMSARHDKAVKGRKARIKAEKSYDNISQKSKEEARIVKKERHTSTGFSSPMIRAHTPSPSRRRNIAKASRYFPRAPIEKASCIPFPALNATSFGLVQERLCHDPFRLLIAVMFLNKTRGKVALPVCYDLFERYPTPLSLANANFEELTGMIHELGLQNQRAERMIRLAQTWVSNPPKRGKRYRLLQYPTKEGGKDIPKGSDPLDDEDSRSAWEIAHLPGTGAYAMDSWRIFCRDELRGLPTGLPQELTAEAVDLEMQKEWTRVMPLDKELRAYLQWRWLRLGWSWNPLTGAREPLDQEENKLCIEAPPCS